ncbi:MAG TPA: 50S ribosomal protein L17 [Candidatus Woesebacteria bacterium]|nr:50S ribosomal protein L17 [Candidatus Woesebacteria bacterium]
MRHRIKGNHFNRGTNNRKALLMNLVRSLIEHGSITTTKAKATEVGRISNKMIAKAKNDTLETRRLLHRFFGKRDIVNTLVDTIAPLFTDRNSGFTTEVDLGTRRGDNASLVKLSLLKTPEKNMFLKAPKKTETKAEVKSAKSAKPVSSPVTKKKLEKPKAKVTKKVK